MTQLHEKTEGRLLCGKEVARRLAISEVTLADWRRLRKGPVWVRLGGRIVRYRELDVEMWLIEQESHPAAIRSAEPVAGR
jgi:predicted DNA-binding transcriptional regulator AlpA